VCRLFRLIEDGHLRHPRVFHKTHGREMTTIGRVSSTPFPIRRISVANSETNYTALPRCVCVLDPSFSSELLFSDGKIDRSGLRERGSRNVHFYSRSNLSTNFRSSQLTGHSQQSSKDDDGVH
jgi:hypothetical protein